RHERIQHVGVVGLDAERNSPNLRGGEAAAERSPRTAVTRAEHPAPAHGREEVRHPCGLSHDDARVGTCAAALPHHRPTTNRALIKTIVCGAYDVVLIVGVDREREE